MSKKAINKTNILTTDTKLDDLLQQIWDCESDYIYSLHDDHPNTLRYFWNEPDHAEAFEDGINFAMQALKRKKPIHTIQCTNGKGHGEVDIEMFFIAEHKELKTLLENTLKEAKKDNE